MNLKNVLLILLFLCFACKNKSNENKEEKFDKVKWCTEQDGAYPYREKMLNDLIDNYELHGIKADSVFNLLGQPDRMDNGHLFYTVYKKYMGNTSFVLSSKTLVIKLTTDSTVEWRKVHG